MLQVLLKLSEDESVICSVWRVSLNKEEDDAPRSALWLKESLLTFHLNINFGFVVSDQIQIGSNEMIVDMQ